MRFGTFVSDPLEWHPESSLTVTGSSLHALALGWLREDKEYRKAEEDAGRMRKSRGARRDQVHNFIFLFCILPNTFLKTVPTDSEVFYKK